MSKRRDISTQFKLFQFHEMDHNLFIKNLHKQNIRLKKEKNNKTKLEPSSFMLELELGIESNKDREPRNQFLSKVGIKPLIFYRFLSLIQHISPVYKSKNFMT